MILFSSVTWALRAQKLLESRGVRTNMRKVAKIAPGGGCGYGLELIGSELRIAVRILGANGIKHIGTV